MAKAVVLGVEVVRWEPKTGNPADWVAVEEPKLSYHDRYI